MALVLGSADRAVGCVRSLRTKVLGLPVWGTDPNEGNTWGVMPVLLRVCPDDGHTDWILAPSVTWNSLIHYTGTVRWYYYPDRETTLLTHASASTQTNYTAMVRYQHLPTEAYDMTDEAYARVDRTLFTRFFGLGPETPASAESSYTMSHAFAFERRALNLDDHFNVGLTVGIEHDAVDNAGIPGLPRSPEVFPDVPGMHGTSTVLSQGLDVRYDDRVGAEFTEEGVRAELGGEVVEGLAGSPTFVRGRAQVSGVVRELDWLSGAGRVYWNGVSSSKAPFYLQSGLGGPFLLRGFTEGRFVDRQAWMVEIEQRVRVLETNLFGVKTDWRLDPFVTVGQVYGSLSDIFDHPRLAGGIGLRAFVHPSVVGRIDLAVGGEGLKTYVEIGYPY